ncbi:MAG: hypothetical protein ACOY4R_12390 [Pseudomonadota bacterium]
MDFKELLQKHPEVAEDRHALTFSRADPLALVADAFSRSSVVKLQGGLDAAMVGACGSSFRRFVESRPEPTTGAGAWYSPWAIQDQGHFPAAVVLAAVIRSWIWDTVEAVCGSPNVAVLLKWCTARHSIDLPLGVGAHQDARVVALEVPLAMWIPLTPIVPGQGSGLGYVIGPTRELLPALPNDDIGAEYVTRDPARLWIPPYALGDLTIHSGFSPHFTTGYGTGAERYSLEMRAMARRAAPVGYLDPAVCVSRRNGVPTIVDVVSAAGDDAQPFLASRELAALAG